MKRKQLLKILVSFTVGERMYPKILLSSKRGSVTLPTIPTYSQLLAVSISSVIANKKGPIYLSHPKNLHFQPALSRG